MIGFLVACQGVPFSLHVGIRERGNLHVTCINVEMNFSEIGFDDYKWANLNAPASYTLWCPSLSGFHDGVPFSQ